MPSSLFTPARLRRPHGDARRASTRAFTRAFTLIELIVTIVILGILAALAVPAFTAVIERSRDSQATATWSAVIREAQALAAFDNRAVTAADIAEALGDLGSAATSVTDSSTDYTYEANGDNDQVVGSGEWIVNDLDAPTALLAMPPGLAPTRVVVVSVPTPGTNPVAEARDYEADGNAASTDAGDTSHHLGSAPASADPGGSGGSGGPVSHTGPAAGSPLAEVAVFSDPALASGIWGTISGNYVYVAPFNASLDLVIVDVSDPDAPQVVGTFDGDAEVVFDVAVSGDYVYLASDDDYAGGTSSSSTQGVFAVNVSDPTNPTAAGSFTGSAVNDLEIVGNHLFALLDGGDALVSYNISNPNAITAAGYLGFTGSSLGDLTAVGSYLYVTDFAGDGTSTDGLHVVSIADPLNPALTAGVTDPGLVGTDFVVSDGSYLYVTSMTNDRLTILNLASPTAPTVVGTLDDSDLVGQLPDSLMGPAAMVLAGDQLYVTSSEAKGVLSIDVTDRTSPSLTTVHVGATTTEGSEQVGSIMLLSDRVVIIDSDGQLVSYGNP